MIPNISNEMTLEDFLFSSSRFARVFIPSPIHRNRALHGDVVVVEVLPEELWSAPKSRFAGEEDDEANLGMIASLPLTFLHSLTFTHSLF